MDILLRGARGVRKKIDIAYWVICLFFVILPIALSIGAVVMLFIQLGRLNDNIFVKLFQIIGELGRARTGWFFEDGATFASVYKNNATEYTWRFLALAVVWFLGGIVNSYHCPECGHFFTMHKISDDKYEGTTTRQVSQTTYQYSDGWTIGDKGNMAYTGITTKGRQYGTRETDHYSYNLKCSCCGCVVKTEKTKSKTNWD